MIVVRNQDQNQKANSRDRQSGSTLRPHHPPIAKKKKLCVDKIYENYQNVMSRTMRIARNDLWTLVKRN